MAAAVDDPVLKFFESGGKADSSVASEKAGNDPVYEFLNSGKVYDAPLPKTRSERLREIGESQRSKIEEGLRTTGAVPAIAGGVENLVQGATGIPAAAGGAVVGLEESIRPGGVGYEQGFHSVADNLTYSPRTGTGQTLSDALAYPFEKAVEFGESAGQATVDKTGSPLLGAAVKTGVAAVPYAILSVLGKKLSKTKEAKVEAAPEEPVIKQEEGKIAPAETPQSKTATQEAEPVRRANVLKRVGLGDEVRKSAVEGDAKAGATDWQHAKPDEPGGEFMFKQFQKEKQALQTHTENIVRDTGGTLGMAEDDLHARGTAIASPFDSIRDVLSKTRKALYEQADQQAGNTPFVKLESVGDFLKKDSEFEGKAANGSLRKGIQSYLREQKILQEDGSLSNITAKQAEGLRQYINDQWSPDTSRLGGRIKGLIDADVLDNAGAEIYKPARELHKKIKDTFDNPKGISKLMDHDPHNPMNRAVPYEKIPDYITRMPLDQFEHVIDVLKSAPEELKGQSASAMSEIKSQMVNKILAEGTKTKGQWNSNGVSKILNDNKAKMKMVFTEEEMAKISDLDEAGRILKVDESYPGAAVQKHNLMTRGAIKALPVAGAAVGETVTGGTGVGAGVGAAGGNAIANMLARKSSLSAAQKRMTKISDMVKEK